MSDSATIVRKLWNYCHVLRDDGLSYQDYIEQLTFLLFLKMADEHLTQIRKVLRESADEEQRAIAAYLLGYAPDKDSAASGYHHVQLAVKRKELSVQTREGYYADR